LLNTRTRHAGRLIVTRHRPGPLPAIYHCRTTPDLLIELVRELAPEHAPDLEPGLADLFALYHGNLRQCFRELYDRCSERYAI
jgi:hypothetical protein